MRKIRLLFLLSKIYKNIHPRKSVWRFINKAIWLSAEELDRVYDAMYFQDGLEIIM